MCRQAIRKIRWENSRDSFPVVSKWPIEAGKLSIFSGVGICPPSICLKLKTTNVCKYQADGNSLKSPQNWHIGSTWRMLEPKIFIPWICICFYPCSIKRALKKESPTARLKSHVVYLCMSTVCSSWTVCLAPTLNNLYQYSQ